MTTEQLFFFFLISGLLRSWPMCAKNFKGTSPPHPLSSQLQSFSISSCVYFSFTLGRISQCGSGLLLVQARVCSSRPSDALLSFPYCAEKWASGTWDKATSSLLKPGLNIPHNMLGRCLSSPHCIDANREVKRLNHRHTDGKQVLRGTDFTRRTTLGGPHQTRSSCDQSMA